MTNKFKIRKTNLKLWRGMAIVAGTFSFVVCMLVLVNFIQINRIDPVNTELINSLVQRLEENPNDAQLREQIREMDLLVRKAYFTNQWQVKAGGYLLLLGVIITAIALQMYYAGKQKLPEISQEEEENIILFRDKARKWVSAGGMGLVVITLVFAFLTHKELGNQFTNAAILSDEKSTESQEELPETTVEKELVASAPVQVAEKKESSASDGNQVMAKDKEQDLAKKQTAPVKEKLEKSSVPAQSKIAEEKPAKTAPKEQAVKKAIASNYPSKEMKANFPSFRGPGGNGIAYHKDIPTDWDGASGKNVIWKTPVPIPSYNSPVIWGDRVFLTGADAQKREVYCFNRNNGKLLWTAPVSQVSGSPDKAPDVTPDTGYAASTLTTDGTNVFAIFANGDLIALDFSGKQVWAKNLGLPDNHYGYASSLLMYKDKLIVQYDNKKNAKVMALSSKSGEVVWTTKRKVRVSWSSPVIVQNGDHAEIILAADPSVAAYNADTGAELWKLDCITGEVGPSVAVANGLVFALNEYASLVAIKPGKNPEVLWEAYDYLSDVPSPVAFGENLFIVTSYGAVVCYNTQSGELQWEKEFDNGFYASPICVEGKIYLLDRSGVMHIFKADKEYQELGSPALGESSDMTPAFVDGRIYIRGEKNLYCIGK